jgi:hypothetical protein
MGAFFVRSRTTPTKNPRGMEGRMKQKTRMEVLTEDPVSSRTTTSRPKRRAFCAVWAIPWESQRARKRRSLRRPRERTTDRTSPS